MIINVFGIVNLVRFCYSDVEEKHDIHSKLKIHIHKLEVTKILIFCKSSLK